MRIKKTLKISAIIFVLFVAAGFVFLKASTYAPLPYVDQVVEDYSRAYVNQAGEKDSSVYVFGDDTATTHIIFYQGGLVETLSYAPLAKALADEGYKVYLPKMPLNLAIMDVGKALPIIEDLDEEDTVLMMGHSLGGTSAAMMIKKNQPSIDGIIFLASYGTENEDFSNETNLKVLSILGTNDTVVSTETYENAKNYLPKNTQYKIIEGGNHANFGDYGAQKGDGIPSIERAKQQEQTVLFIKEFIDTINE